MAEEEEKGEEEEEEATAAAANFTSIIPFFCFRRGKDAMTKAQRMREIN